MKGAKAGHILVSIESTRSTRLREWIQGFLDSTLFHKVFSPFYHSLPYT
jgi:hypothetical protein